jgi:cytochrome c biogenesis protein
VFNNNKAKLLKKFANLQLALGLLVTIGLLIAIGTVIDQNQSLQFYKENYSEFKPLFGFLTWKVITILGLNNIYTAWWFFLVLFLFGSSLLACTFTTQLPLLKTFKIWKFLNKSFEYRNLKVTENIKLGTLNSIAFNCNVRKYHFFRQHKKGYGYSGLLGKFAPIIVHISIIILLCGSTVGSFSGYIAHEIAPRGEIFHVQNLIKFGKMSYVPQEVSLRINNFWINYIKKTSKIDQFYSDISVMDPCGNEIKRKIIFVNEPLVFKDVVLYQTNWDILGIKVRFQNKEIYQIPIEKIDKGLNHFWFGSFSFKTNLTMVVLNDLVGKIFFYDAKGFLIQEFLIGDSIFLNKNLNVQMLDFITSTGLQIKSDPSIILVYLGFFLLMLSIYISFFSYSQIWLLEFSKKVEIGGNSTRSVLFFQEDFRKLITRSKPIVNLDF